MTTIPSSSSASATTTTTVVSAKKKSSCEKEEYERAVAFLREFHSRRVAALDSIHGSAASTGLDAIIEAEDMLANDFELALSVTKPPWEMTLNEESNNRMAKRKQESSSFERIVADDDDVVLRRSPPRVRGLSRMKKATTSKCLLDLDDSVVESSSSSACPASISSDDKSLFASTESLSSMNSGGIVGTNSLFGLRRTTSSEELDVDYYLGFDEMMCPATKRHCGHHLGFARS
eukprot:CAMPEP_0181122802 /NCGR_PEP_ID=MMETSP1071-20121207/25520_1 /TAXON_ID=35127 /ORGANISM="Thalassiosira sp., Strain NH16" /LENGTH=232 /DNA_ID=CAMNT_0023207821 /DNA_START=268 /DNA_END=966 /DNA_ORIENTATION=+